MVLADRELVQAVLRGDRRQFAGLVQRYQRDIYNLAYRSTHNRQDAEDITQEVFLRAFRSLARYDETRPFRSWLYAIAVNVCRDWARRQASRPREAPLEGSAGEEAGRSPELPADGPLPAEVAAARDMQRQVQAALMELDPEYRLLVILFYVRGMSQAEIAEVTGLPLTVVKNRLYRARQRLRAILAPAVETGGAVP